MQPISWCIRLHIVNTVYIDTDSWLATVVVTWLHSVANYYVNFCNETQTVAMAAHVQIATHWVVIAITIVYVWS